LVTFQTNFVVPVAVVAIFIPNFVPALAQPTIGIALA